MTFYVLIEKLVDHIYVKLEGQETLANVIDVWKRVAEACDEFACLKVLVDGILEGPMATIDIYDLGQMFRDLMPAGVKIAFVVREDQIRKMNFAETVVGNRSVANTCNFLDRADAQAWLLADTA